MLFSFFFPYHSLCCFVPFSVHLIYSFTFFFHLTHWPEPTLSRTKNILIFAHTQFKFQIRNIEAYASGLETHANKITKSFAIFHILNECEIESFFMVCFRFTVNHLCPAHKLYGNKKQKGEYRYDLVIFTILCIICVCLQFSLEIDSACKVHKHITHM